MGMFSGTEIILMIGIVSVLLIVITILTILDIKEYKKNNDLLKDISMDEEKDQVKEDTIEQEEIYIDDLTEEVISTNCDEIMIEEVLDNDIVLEEIEEPVKEETIIEPVLEKKVNLNEELEKALDTMNVEENVVPSFEEEQERTAIISLDDLLARGDEIYNNNEMMQYDDGNEPISIDEVINMFEKQDKKEIPVISSMYGIEKSDQNLEFENTATYEKLSREKKNEFMTKLREINENK